MPEPRVFVFTGHGDESVGPPEQRRKLPDGITLVTFAVCGTTAALTDIINTLEKMKEKQPFLDPVSFQSRGVIEKLLGKPLRVYTPGMAYPQLQYSSLGVHSPPEKEGKAYEIFFRSGVYELPVKPMVENPDWKNNGVILRHKPTRYTLPAEDSFAAYGVPVEQQAQEKPTDPVLARQWEAARARRIQVATSSYEGSVFPSQADKDRIVNGGDDGVPIETVFETLGKGVYYWPICRGRMSDWSEESQEMVPRVRSYSDARQTERILKSMLGKPGGQRKRKTRRRRKQRKAH